MHLARLIVLTGLPGTGKSQLARRLARHYSMPLIAKDTIKEPLLDKLGAGIRVLAGTGTHTGTHTGIGAGTGVDTGTQSRELSDLSFAILFSLAKELLAAGVDLILEGNFRKSEHPAVLLATLPERGVRIVQILCRTQEAERQLRLAARAADPARHPGHRDALQTMPVADCDTFLDLPGLRLLFDSGGANTREPELIETLDGYWRAAP